MTAIREWAYRNLKGDPWVWAIFITLSLLSILVVYSATSALAYRRMGGDTEYYLFKHGLKVVISIGAVWIIHRLNHTIFLRLSRVLLLLSLPLLLFTWLFGMSVNEASRWLVVPIINQPFQPSDLASIALLIHVTHLIFKCRSEAQGYQKRVPEILFLTALVCSLIAMTNISSASLLFFTVLVILFVGGMPLRFWAAMFALGCIVAMSSYFFGQRGETALSRVKDYMNQEQHFQEVQSRQAIISGGIIGKGPGRSDQRRFLPHAYSDFIYAIIVEEYGMVGGIIVLALYLLLLDRGIRALRSTSQNLSGLLCFSLTLFIVLQALANICVTVGLLPITGLPLPMVSMGGTSQLFMGVSIGIILNVNRSGHVRDVAAIGNRVRTG